MKNWRQFRKQKDKQHKQKTGPKSYASVNSSSALPPPPRATVGHLLTLSVPGVGHVQFFRGPGAGHLRTPGRPPGIWHTCFRSAMDEFTGKDEASVEQWLVRQGLEKLVDVLKVCFLNLRYFFITCKHINISDKVNYILFITKQSLTWTRLFCISHSKLA